MKFFTAKIFSLMLLLSGFAATINADHYPVRYAGEECCASSCYECGCNPVYCGAWDLQVHGGVAPIIWRHRSPVFAVSCSDVFAPATVVTVFEESPRFKTLFKTPWTVGGQVGFAWSDNTRAYLEFNYLQAKAKTDVNISSDLTVVGSTLPVVLNFEKYKLFDAYVGVRYYWDRWCDRVAFFLGGKVGLTHHKRTDFVLGFALTPAVSLPAAQIYNNNTVVSGGADFGLDVCFCGNWSFVIQASVIASCGPNLANVLPLPTGLATPLNLFTNIIPGHIGTELRFPVTAGIRYSF